LNHNEYQDKDRGIRILTRLVGEANSAKAAGKARGQNEFFLADKNAAKPAIAPLRMK
jgi:hypothetical protein